MITINVIQRIFQIRYNNATGTCFSIDHNNRQYIVTAKHVIDGLQTGSTIEIFHDNDWRSLIVNLVGHHTTQDVSVFALNQFIAAHSMQASSNQLAYSQDVYFLGFPFGLQDVNNAPLNRQFPIPLVKKAIVSAIINDAGGNYMLLDGHNNPGFSGGPVVFKRGAENTFNVAGIISGYRVNHEPILVNNNPQNDIIHRANTGIIIAPMIENAVELIDSNPIGFEIPNDNT